MPDTSLPEVRDYILKRMDEDSAQRRGRPVQGYSVHPLDSPAFSESPHALALFGKPEKVNDAAETHAEAFNYANYYFYLIDELAKRMKQTHPGMVPAKPGLCQSSLRTQQHRPPAG